VIEKNREIWRKGRKRQALFEIGEGDWYVGWPGKQWPSGKFAVPGEIFIYRWHNPWDVSKDRCG